MKTIHSLLLIPTLAVSSCTSTPPSPQQAAAIPPVAAEELDYADQWRIEVRGGADSNGQFVFRVTPEGNDPQLVTIWVDDGEGENEVARTIRSGFETQLDSGQFDSEVDDGEEVVIERTRRAPDFAVEVVSSTVEGVKLGLDDE